VTAHVTVSHTFEAAHRLPHLPGKCQSLHGHSWRVDVAVSAPDPNGDGILVEFGAFKRALRHWIDDQLDHATMLGPGDRLATTLLAEGKVYLFDRGYSTGYRWPTVENVAATLARVATVTLGLLEAEDVPVAAKAAVTRVVVRETATNSAAWTP
jgi:6-pyruvoyltetrahydropterin/6-carboxytetrahydropterin synthase